LGICLYTVSKPWVLAVQAAAFWYVRTLGARLLPGRTTPWSPPCSAEEWSRLIGSWTGTLGPVDGLAVYQRRQHDRPGLTLLATRRGRPLAVIKLRQDDPGLDREQQALSAVEAARPQTFRAPRALGSGTEGAWCWSAQQAVFVRPHRPVLGPDPRLFDEIRDILAAIVTPPTADERPSHRDLTPWNLRRDANGQTWLFDWEDAAAAPTGTDRVYFCASATALGAGPPPAGLPADAIAYCRSLIQARTVTTKADGELAAAMLAALDTMAGRGVPAG
jgi:hypothetical protein